MRVAGFSLVSNAVALDFPILESLRSLLPLCDELVVNVGPSSDGTLELVRSLDDPRLRLIEGEWDATLGGRMLAVETQRALEACRGDWAIYIQADEVLHEDGIDSLSAAMADRRGDPGTEGLVVDFVHFYGSADWVAGGRAWYRREVRVVRPGGSAVSHAEAQGFRRRDGARLRARPSGATYHHYGWARPMSVLAAKRVADNALYYGGEARRAPVGERLPWEVGLRRFAGTHPRVMREWIAARRASMSPGFAPSRWTRRRLALLAALGIERLTGWRPFEYRNYVEV
ncbi:MAG: glycosyltransferase family 2 protein [Gemmatimonadota bacterium]|nr:glycosyltransferase family 2 protein [Gemmatimonadota bacterium]MDH4347543.1 glycosyltransferase family 2 protein [Gemmatimonadota bacterium]MDH5284156.1 glycosyltransferase family 2 protein [Gemmatimonadota bacterium]